MEKRTFCVPGVTEAITVLWLTPRERRVLRLVCQGKTSKEMATSLCLSGDTVRQYVSNLGHSIGAALDPPVHSMTRGELMVWGLQNPGALDPDGIVLRGRHPEGCQCGSGYCQAMNGSAKPNWPEIERVSLRRLEEAKAEYEELLRRNNGSPAVDTPDASETCRATMAAALNRYKEELDRFARIVLHREVPS